MKRTKTCGWCEWFTLNEPTAHKSMAMGKCKWSPQELPMNRHAIRCGVGFQWNEEAYSEMLVESEAAVKEALDFSSKGKG